MLVANRKTFTASCSTEIRIHKLVFFSIVCSLAGLIFPSFVLFWIIYALVTMAVQPGWLPESSHEFILHNWSTFNIATILLLSLLYGLWIRNKLREKTDLSDSPRKLNPVPATDKGDLLRAVIVRLWKTGTGNPLPIPQVKWFVNFNTLARATENGGLHEIQVSSSLWERIVGNDAMAELILSHEMAHLAHKDLPVFKILEVVSHAVTKLIRWVLAAVIFTAIYAAGYQLVSDIVGRHDLSVTIIHLSGGPVVTFFVILPVLIGRWATLRYSAFIISLIELRADVTAAEWIGSTAAFVKTLRNDSTVQKSAASEIVHSFLSLNINHFTNTGRLNILNSTDRIISPKLRYFALSILLVLLVPLNSFTPMVWNGSLDQFFFTSTILALQISLFQMILSAPPNKVLGWKRTAILGTALFFATGLATVNTYQLGYYFTEVGASFYGPNGFVDKFFSLPDLASDGLISMQGMFQEFADAYGSWTAIPSILLCIWLLRSFSVISSGVTNNRKSMLIGSILVGYATLIACYDPWRDALFHNFLLSPAVMLNQFKGEQQLRFTLPVIVMVVFTFFLRLKKKFKSR